MGSMPGTMGLGAGSFAAVWALMMAAMMLPSVAPFASLYSRTFTGAYGARLAAFASGYLIVWTMAALPAYGLAWLASRLAGGHPAAATVLAAAIFAACGAYQLTPVKERCLARCRSPLGFMLKLGAYRGRTRGPFPEATAPSCPAAADAMSVIVIVTSRWFLSRPAHYRDLVTPVSQASLTERAATCGPGSTTAHSAWPAAGHSWPS